MMKCEVLPDADLVAREAAHIIAAEAEQRSLFVVDLSWLSAATIRFRPNLD